MELRQLEYLVAVVEEGGFTRAAERLRVAQPGVSAQVRRLERELRQELFTRGGRTVSLTEAGRAVLPYARAALSAVAAVRDTAAELTGLLRGRVTLGVVASPRALDLPGLLAAFHERHPDIEVTMRAAPRDALLAGLRDGSLDAALVSYADRPPRDVEVHVCWDEPIVAAVAPGDPLADRTTVRLPELRGRRLVSLPPGSGMRDVLESACAAAGFAPVVAFEAPEPYGAAQLAALGLGVAVLPASAVEAVPGGLRAAGITGPALRGRMALAWPAGAAMSPAARVFTAMARERLPGV